MINTFLYVLKQIFVVLFAASVTVNCVVSLICLFTIRKYTKKKYLKVLKIDFFSRISQLACLYILFLLEYSNQTTQILLFAMTIYEIPCIIIKHHIIKNNDKLSHRELFYWNLPQVLSWSFGICFCVFHQIYTSCTTNGNENNPYYKVDNRGFPIISYTNMDLSMKKTHLIENFSINFNDLIDDNELVKLKKCFTNFYNLCNILSKRDSSHYERIITNFVKKYFNLEDENNFWITPKNEKSRNYKTYNLPENSKDYEVIKFAAIPTKGKEHIAVNILKKIVERLPITINHFECDADYKNEKYFIITILKTEKIENSILLNLNNEES